MQESRQGVITIAPASAEVQVATLDGTPLMAGGSALPGLIGTLALAYGAARLQRPRWSRWAQLALATAWFGLLEAAYLLHSVGHIHSARRVAAPMDSVTMAWGLFVNNYKNNEVTARQHIGRAAGGLLMSSTLTVTALPFYALLSRIPILGELAEIWLLTNAIILAGSMIPTPHFDGAALLKWGVVQRTGEESLGDEAVQQAGSLTVGALMLAALFLMLRGKWRAAIAAAISGMITAADLFWLKGRLP